MFYNRLFIMNYSISLLRRLFLLRSTYRNRNGLRILDS
nr:MAG TPA: hypothetical protein [Bacteriophage sp.]